MDAFSFRTWWEILNLQRSLFNHKYNRGKLDDWGDSGSEEETRIKKRMAVLVGMNKSDKVQVNKLFSV